MLSPKKKKQVIKKNARHEKDTGSPEVQVAILSERIEQVSKHLQKNPKDKHTRRGLLKLVDKRRKHKGYLDRKTGVKKTVTVAKTKPRTKKK